MFGLFKSSSLKAKDENTSSHLTPSGLKILADGKNPILDIVAIHGLNGHREETWTVDGVNWLRDLLPLQIPGARIYSWGYDASTHSTAGTSREYLHGHAATLVSDLCLERKMTETQTHPIIFVAHSLGGIVLKAALIQSDAARNGALEELRSIKLSTYGIVFMGTPHQGGNGVQLGQVMVNLGSILMTTNDKLLQHLERDSEMLQQQAGHYAPISAEFVTKFAYETYATRTALGNKTLIVPRASAVVPGLANAEPIAIPADHIGMVKFASKEDEGYKKVSGHLRLMAKVAPGTINARWAEQEKIKMAQAHMKDDFSVVFSLSGVAEIEQFVGRKKELTRIKKAFQGLGSQRKVVILCGLGGIGKTQLAVASMKEHRDIYPAIFWLNGQNEDTLKQSFARMAKRLYNEHPSSSLLKTIAEEKDANRIVTLIKEWLSSRGNSQWILVFDNVDNPKLTGIEDSQAYDIRLYFPEALQGSILITTRSALEIGEVIPVKKLLDTQECIDILASTSRRADLDQDPDVMDLVNQLDGLPLALTTTGAYLSQVSASLKNYLRRYKDSWLEVQKASPALFSYERALHTTWNLSLEHIEKQNKSAGKFLYLWAYFDPQDLWFDLFAAGSKDSPEWFATMVRDETCFESVIRLLVDHALVEPVNSPAGYSMHGCVHAWVMHELNSQRDISMARLALNCVGSAVPSKDTSEYWVIERRLLPHAHKCLESIHDGIDIESPDNQTIYSAIFGLGNLYAHQDKLEETQAMYGKALAGFEKTLGTEHMLTLNTVNNLAAIYTDLGEMQTAKAMYWRALEGKEKALGSEHTSTLDTVKDLANFYLIQENIEEAEAMYERALEGYEKALGPEDSSTLNAVHSLGVLYATHNKLGEAETMFLRALDGFKKRWGPEHQPMLDTLNSLSNVYSKQGKKEEAEDMCQRALTGYEKAFGPERVSTLSAVETLGNIYAGQGKMGEAEAMYKRALEGSEKIFGPMHTSTLGTVYDLGACYAGQGKMNEAEPMFKRALEGYEKALGPEHLTTLRMVDHIRSFYPKLGKEGEVELLDRPAKRRKP